MNAQVCYERLKNHLLQLKLETALNHLDPVLEGAMRAEQSTVEVLEKLLHIEVQERFERRLRTNFRLSGLPVKKRLEDFDFEAQPQVPKAMLQELATLRFLNQGENILLIGSCGVGKTHLAIGLALKALESGHRVNFTTTHNLVAKVHQARMRQRLDRLLTTYLNAELLIIDELGFLPFESPEANFLFELVNARYQRQKSLIITSNKTFAQWEELFPDRVMAVALLDRLMHHGHIIAVAIRKAQGLAYGYRALQIRGESYRLKHRKKAGLSPLPV